MITDNKHLITAAEKHYDHFKVPTSSVESTKRKRRYTAEDKADLDFKTSENGIGLIVNESQELNTLIWDELNRGASIEDIMPIYYDAALLDVLSMTEIDRAKKEFGINTYNEVKRIKEQYTKRDKKGRAVKPAFFGHVAKQKGYYDPKRKKYQHHLTTMDFLQDAMRKQEKFKSVPKFVPFSQLIAGKDESRFVYKDQIERIIWAVRDARANIDAVWRTDDFLMDRATKHILTANIKQETVDYINNTKMTKTTMRHLLAEIESPKNTDVCRFIFYNLFANANSDFYNLIKESATPISAIYPSEDGDMDLYGIKYATITF